MMYVMMMTGKTLKTEITPLGILDLEFTHYGVRAEKILIAWSAQGDTGSIINDAKRNTYLDFIFLLFYSSFLFCSCKLMVKKGVATYKKIANLFAYASLAAGFLDILENIGMLKILNGSVSGSITFFTTACAILKWTLVILVILFLLIGLIVKLLPRKKFT